MTGTTPRGLPYPEGTDLVMEGDDAMQALAEAVDLRTPSMYYGNAQMAGAANAVRSVTVTYPADLFLTAPAVMLQVLTGTTNADGTNTETWVNNRSTVGCTVNCNRNNTTTITINWFAMERTGPYTPAVQGEVATFAGRVGAGFPDGHGDEPVPAPTATVTCPTPGCYNQGKPLEVVTTWEEDGITYTATVECGVCGADITDTAVPIDPDPEG